MKPLVRVAVLLLWLLSLAPPAQGQGFNIDFAGPSWGPPSAGYGAASGQAGQWNEIFWAGGTTPLQSLNDDPTPVSLTLPALSANSLGPGTNDDRLLLNDYFVTPAGSSWSVSITNLVDGAYRVYLYAPPHAVVTGAMTVGGIPVASIDGDPGASLNGVESYVGVTVPVVGGTLAISGAGGISGLAGLQLAPLTPQRLNVDFGRVFVAGAPPGQPTAGYGAAAGQSGPWNEADEASDTALLDAYDKPSGVTIHVEALNSNSHASSLPDGPRLLQDHFLVGGGNTWSVSLSGLGAGIYRVVLYASPDSSVSGAMDVGGVAVASIPGDPGSGLIEHVSWVGVTAIAADSSLVISGSAPGDSGLAGLQLVPRCPSRMPPPCS